MPKVDIDYSNTIFYKIFCKDPAIKDLYVGLTTNFVQRRHAHKQSCKNEKALNHNCKLYSAIRKEGGWDNWQMEIIAFHNCADSYEARKKEQGYFEALGATLNSIDPFPKPKIRDHVTKDENKPPKLFCEPCKVYFSHWTAYETHNHTKKHHKMVATSSPNASANDNANKQKISSRFFCPGCNYGTSRKSNFETHILSNKHKTSILTTNDNEIKQHLSKNYHCPNCDKDFNDRAGLWRHKKKCTNENTNAAACDIYNETQYSIHDKDNLILMLIKQNAELIKESSDLKHLIIGTQTKMLEVIKNVIVEK
jgi:predicted RNA-binding Zn-ribbon protein involved in translation (DUF1610 family)